jgi:hypothetical protein
MVVSREKVPLQIALSLYQTTEFKEFTERVFAKEEFIHVFSQKTHYASGKG